MTKNIWILVAALLLVPAPAVAEAVLFTDRSAFESALSGEFQPTTILNRNGLSDIVYRAGGDFPGVWHGGFSGYHSYFFNPFMTTPTMTAVGFDFVDRKTFSDTGPVPPPFLGVPFYDPNGPIPNLLFSFNTASGHGQTTVVPFTSFLGVMLLNDVFSDFRWETDANCGFCISLFVLDGITLQTAGETSQAVPEPATFALLGLGLLGIMLARRRL